MRKKNALVIGAGAFGTSMASVISHNFEQVIMKVRGQEIYDCLKKGENNVYLPKMKLSPNIIPALTWDEVNNLCDGELDLMVSALPSGAILEYLSDNSEYLEPYLDRGIPFVSLSKGIDQYTLELPDDLLLYYLSAYKDQLCYLSGPSFAKEIVEKQVTLVSIASSSLSTLKQVNEMLETDYFKLFTTYDIKGLLLGGALKNILAIAGGIIEGMGYNHNTRAALITRGIVEMLRFGKVFNARTETFYGLSGMGDLILTTTGGLSRNKQFGLEIAKGRDPKQIIEETRSVVEGYKTTRAAHQLAEKFEIRTLIFDGMYEILYEGKSPQHILEKFLHLPGKIVVE